MVDTVDIVSKSSVNKKIAKYREDLWGLKCRVKELEEIVAEEPNKYPHKCNVGHGEIGYNNTESGVCPLCKSISQTEDLESSQRILLFFVEEVLNHCTDVYLLGKALDTVKVIKSIAEHY